MEFQCKTKIISGAGSLAKLKTLGIRKLFLVTDPYFAQNGTAAKLQQLSGAEQVVLFDKVTPDPREWQPHGLAVSDALMVAA